MITNCPNCEAIDCPNCKAIDIAIIDSGTWPDGRLWDELECQSCGTLWFNDSV